MLKKFLLTILLLINEIYFVNTSYIYLLNNSEKVFINDVFEVSIKIDSQKEINSAGGRLFFDKNLLEVVGLSTDKSIFNLWTEMPTFNNNAGFINFVGGTINPWKGEGGDIIKIYFKAKKDGSADIESTSGFSVFLNDGFGTLDEFTYKSMKIEILSGGLENKDNLWNDLIEKDKESPRILEIQIGNDKNLLGGKHFLSFSAEDTGSGIEKYEVKEGGDSWKQLSGIYILEDQSLKKDVSLRVTDKAGNVTISVVEGSGVNKIIILYILLGVFAISGIITLWISRRK